MGICYTLVLFKPIAARQGTRSMIHHYELARFEIGKASVVHSAIGTLPVFDSGSREDVATWFHGHLHPVERIIPVKETVIDVYGEEQHVTLHPYDSFHAWLWRLPVTEADEEPIYRIDQGWVDLLKHIDAFALATGASAIGIFGD